MVVDWEQETGLLMTSGDVRVVRIWDTDREMKVQVRAAEPTRVLSPVVVVTPALFTFVRLFVRPGHPDRC